MRSLLALVTMSVALAALSFCSPVPSACEEGQVAGPDGSCRSAPPPYCQPCEGRVASKLPAADCVAEGCPGSVAYAVCSASCWSVCSCSIPAGYTLVDAGFFAAEAGDAPDEPDGADGTSSADAKRTFDAPTPAD
jgi:hypothetical protein